MICPHDLLIPVGDVPTLGGWFVVNGRTFKAHTDGALEFQEVLRADSLPLVGAGLHTHIFILYTVSYETKGNYHPNTTGSRCAHPTPAPGAQ